MKLVILDRDGTINHDSDQYIKSPEEWKPIKGSLEAIGHVAGDHHDPLHTGPRQLPCRDLDQRQAAQPVKRLRRAERREPVAETCCDDDRFDHLGLARLRYGRKLAHRDFMTLTSETGAV